MSFETISFGPLMPLHLVACAHGHGGGVTAARAGGGQSAPQSPHDHVSQSAAFQQAPPERQQLHIAILEYADANGCDYAEAYRAVSLTP